MSLHHYLLRLIWACMLPLLLLACVFAYQNINELEAQREKTAQEVVDGLILDVDRNLTARIGGLQVLATSSAARKSANRADFYREAQSFYANFGSHVILADLDYQMLFNTRVPLGTALPHLPRSNSRSAAPAVIETGKPAVGDIVFGPIAKEPLLAIAVPVRSGDNVKPDSLLLTLFETRQFQTLLDKTPLPEGWELGLLDGSGKAIAFRPATTNPQDEAAERFVAKSTMSLWSAEVRIPAPVHRAPLIKTMLILAMVILVATLIALLAGKMVGRRLALSVSSLVDSVNGKSPDVDISEIAQARQMLAESISRRVAAELRSNESEDRFRTIFEKAPMGIAIVAPDGRWLMVNDMFCNIVGYPHDDLINRPFSEITSEGDVESDLDALRRLAAGEISTYSSQKRYRRKDGTLVWVNRTGTMVRTTDGSPRYVVAIIEDITDRIRTEKALRDSEAAFKDAQKMAGIGNWSWSPVTGERSWSEETYRIYGVDPSLPPPPVPDFGQYFTPESWERMYGCIQTCQQDGKPYSLDVEIIRPGGTHRWATAHGRPLLDANGKVIGLQGTIQDITERRAAGEQLRATLEGVIASLATTLEQRDVSTAGHQRRAAQLAVAIGRELGLDEDRVEGLRIAGVIFDIGKMSVPADILSRPRAFSKVEMELVKSHAQAGYDIVKGIAFPWPVGMAIRQHHERMDGSGYPLGLKGNDIILEARILAVADVVEAMTAHRPYRPAFSLDATLKEIETHAGTKYDPDVVAACLKLFRDKGFAFF